MQGEQGTDIDWPKRREEMLRLTTELQDVERLASCTQKQPPLFWPCAPVGVRVAHVCLVVLLSMIVSISFSC